MSDAQVLLVYDTRFGHTFQVVQALERGLGRVAGVRPAHCFYADVTPDLLDRAHMVMIGGPTEGLSASSHIKRMFRHIGGFDLRGKYGFAFDTHPSGPLGGSAARYIEKELAAMGLRLLEPRRSAIIVGRPRDAAGTDRLALESGAEERFEALGEALGHELVAALAEHPPVRSGEPTAASA